MYINDLAGIEFDNIEELADADQVSWTGVWADVQNRALRRFKLDVLGKISGFDKKYRLKQITQTVDLGRSVDAADTTAPDTQRRGHTIELNEINATCVCSNMQVIYIQSTSFYSTFAGALSIEYRNIDTQELLLTKTFTAVTGWNLVKVEHEFEVARLSVTIDTTALTTVNLDLTGFGLDLWNSGQKSCGCSAGFGSYLWFEWGCACTSIVQGYEFDLISTTETYATNTFGMSSVFSIKCSYNNIVCKNKMHFANAFLYLLGSELMTERLYSSRLNRWTTVDRVKAQALREEFEIQYRGGQLSSGIEFEGELFQACYNIDLDKKDCCIECDAEIKFQEAKF